MKLSFFIAAAFLLVFAASPGFAFTADELAAKLQGAYDNTADMTADFAQTTEVKAMLIKKEGSGTLLIRKPGMLRYTYTKPERQEIIVRDEQLFMYTPSTRQAVRKSLDHALMDKTPSTFLAGLGRITDTFSVRLPKTGDRDKKGGYTLELVPKGDKMGIEKIALTLDPKTFLITAFSFTEASGNTNTIRLANIKTNVGVKSTSFNFKLPEGTNVITE